MGTRIAGAYPGIPKPMIPLCGKPVLQRAIESLKNEGIEEFFITTGNMADRIEDYFGTGSRFGVRIGYYRETEPLGTAGALYRLGLKEDFLLVNGDLVFSFDLDRMIGFHKSRGALITLFAHPSSHPADSTAVICGADGRVERFVSKDEQTGHMPNLCNAGIHIISPEAFERRFITGAADLDRDVVAPLIPDGAVYAYRSPEYVHDMGTPERAAIAERDIRSGIVGAKNLRRRQRAVFLDRDGTLNKYKGFITDPAAIEPEPGAADAVRKINESGMLAVVISNQPVVARGDCSFEELDRINGRLERLLGEKGAVLDAIYCCTHHPDAGFPGEVPELKVVCDCRKPAPGLILRAARELNIDLSASYMAGDSLTDVRAAVNAGCMPVYLRGGKSGPEPSDLGVPVFDSLIDFVDNTFAEK